MIFWNSRTKARVTEDEDEKALMRYHVHVNGNPNPRGYNRFEDLLSFIYHHKKKYDFEYGPEESDPQKNRMLKRKIHRALKTLRPARKYHTPQLQ